VIVPDQMARLAWRWLSALPSLNADGKPALRVHVLVLASTGHVRRGGRPDSSPAVCVRQLSGVKRYWTLESKFSFSAICVHTFATDVGKTQNTQPGVKLLGHTNIERPAATPQCADPATFEMRLGWIFDCGRGAYLGKEQVLSKAD